MLLVSIVIVIAVTLDIVRGAIVQPTVIPTNPCSAQNIAQEINKYADFFVICRKRQQSSLSTTIAGRMPPRRRVGGDHSALTGSSWSSGKSQPHGPHHYQVIKFSH